MTDGPNGPNGPDENGDGGVNKNKPSSDSIYAKAYKGFVNDRTFTEGVGFINRYYALADTDTSYKDEFMSYINDKSGVDDDFHEIGDDFKDKMSLGKIKALLGPEFVKFKNNRTKLKGYIIQMYDIDSDAYDAAFSADVENLSISELQKLMGNTSRIDSFIEEKSIDPINKRNIAQFLESLNIQEGISKIKDKEKREEILYQIDQNFMNLDPSSPVFVNNMSEMFSTLFSEGLINKAQKLEILLSYVPVLTLNEAKTFELINDDQIKKYIENVVLDEVDDTQKAEIYGKLRQKLYEVFVYTKDLVGNNEKFMDIVAKKKGFREIAQQAQDLHTNSQKDGPQSLQDLQAGLAKIPEKVISPEKFLKGNIMEIEVVQDDKSVQVQYYEIFATQSDASPHSVVSFQNKGGDGVYLPKNVAKLEKKSYQDFIELSGGERIKKIEFTDKTHFEQKIASGDIIEDTGDFVYRTGKDKEGRILRHQADLEDRFVEDGLMQAGDDLDTVIRGLDDDQRENYAESLQGIENAARLNTFHLQQDLDQFDKDGKDFGFEQGTTFETSDGEQYGIHSIQEGQHTGEIGILLIGGEVQIMSFDDFLRTFKERKCKRKAKVVSPESLLEDVNRGGEWSGIKYKRGALINETDPENHYVCDYLAAGDRGSTFWGDYNVLKLHNISGDTAEVSLGTIKKGADKESMAYNVSRNKTTVSLGILATWIKKAGLQAQNIKQENVQEEYGEGNDQMYSSMWGKYLKNFASITTVIQAGKSYIEFFEQYLNEGRDEQASRLVAKLPVLTEEQRSAAITHLENAEKKRMEEYLEKLKIRDSLEATEMVERWLRNKDSLEAQKEAALFYMIEKYGVLYEKNALIKHKGTWLWYKALGGRVGDELFREQEAKAKDLGIQFTEENLVHILILLQGRGVKKPKRRGKLYKEYEAVIGKGLEDEIEKGQKDADKKRTPEEREKHAIEEAANGGWPNSFGAMESLVNKGFDGDMARLNSIPFVLMTSGAAYSFAPGQADKFKNGMIPTQFFAGKKDHIDSYNATVVQLAHDIERELGGEYIGMGKIFDDLINRNIGLDKDKKRGQLDEKQRVEYSYSLFKDTAGGKWGETLSRALLRLNTRKTDKEAEFETWIGDHQDNHIYASYEGLFNGGLDATKDARFKNEEVIKDGFKMNEDEEGTGGMSGFDVYETVKEFIQPVTGGYGFRNKDLGMMFWKELTGQIDAIAGNQNLSKDYKKNRIGNILKGFMDGMSESYGQRSGSVQEIMKNPGDNFYQRFAQWGVQEGDFSRLDGDFLKGGGAKIIDRYVDNILSSSGMIGRSGGGMGKGSYALPDNSPLRPTVKEGQETTQKVLDSGE